MCVFVFRPWARLTGGEKNFLFAAIGLGIVGAVLALVITLRLSAHGATRLAFDPFTFWIAVAGFVGAVTGLMSTYRRWFGFSAGTGWMRAVIGGLTISAVGSVVAGTLILPYYGTMFAPFQLIIAMIERPVLAVIWVAMLVCVHKLLVHWRDERDSIFRVPNRTA